MTKENLPPSLSDILPEKEKFSLDADNQKPSFFRNIFLFLMASLSFVLNLSIAVLGLLMLIIFNQDYQSYALKNYIFPTLGRFNIIKIQAEDIRLDMLNHITAKKMKIYDDEGLFLDINSLKIAPKEITNILAGFEKIEADKVVVYKKPIFKRFQTDNPNHEKDIVPSLPFDIFDISINQLILMPPLTQQKKPLNFVVSGKTDFINNQKLSVKAILKDYSDAIVNADIIKVNKDKITLDASLQAPATLINSLIGQKFFSKQVMIKANGAIDLKDISNNKIDFNFPSFLIKDSKRVMSGNVKTLFTSKPFKLASTTLNIKSDKSSLLYKGDILQNSFDGNLKAQSFNVTDFYPINPLLARLLIDGDIKIKGNYQSVPSVIGIIQADAIYDKIPLNAKLSGDYQKNISNIKLNVAHQKSNIITGNVTFNNQNKSGNTELTFSPIYFPKKIEKQLPVIIGSSQIKTNFKQTKKGIIFDNGLAKIASIAPKELIQDYDITLKSIQFNFFGKQDALNVKNVNMISKINNAEYHTHGDIAFYDQSKIKDLNLALTATQNPAEKLSLSIVHKNQDLIDLKVSNFNPNRIKDNLLGINIDTISGEFTGQANSLTDEPLKTLSGNYSILFSHTPQNFSRIDVSATGKINRGNITQGNYHITQNQTQIGSGTISASDNFQSIKVSANNDLKVLSSLFEDSPHQASGDMTLNLTIINGVPTGILRVRDGTYHDVINDIKFERINLDAGIFKEYIDVQTLTANSIPRGTIKGIGRISISETANSNFKLTSDRFSIQNNMINLRANSELTLNGNINQYQLAGTINITDLAILLPDLKSQTIPKLNIIEPTKAQTPQNNIPFLSKIATDISIFIKEGSKITGFGIEGFPKGNLRVYNTLYEPYVDGTIEVARGSIEVFGKEFKITQGGINFKKTKPFMNITAVHRIDDRDIFLKFKGLVDNPELEFTAQPAIAKDEIIALLIYGKDKKSLSPFQALRLGTALYQLSRGKSNSNSKYDVIGKTERLLNVDELSISSGNNNSVSIGAGKYIDDDIYVATDYNPVLSESIFRLELRLTQTLQLESILNTSNNSPNQTEIMLKRRQDY